jgi:hypothetical protein
MPIRQLLDSNAFNPEEVTMLRAVFEDTLRALKLVDRSDPVTLLIAKKIIGLARRGERDPARCVKRPCRCSRMLRSAPKRDHLLFRPKRASCGTHHGAPPALVKEGGFWENASCRNVCPR